MNYYDFQMAERLRTATSHENIGAELVAKAKPPKRKRVSKAQALVDFGLATDLKDARAQLADMGE